jgi:hypothetical protein
MNRYEGYWPIKQHRYIKGIVSRDLKVYFLVPLDTSGIATPDRTGLFLFYKSRFRVEFFIIWALVLVVFSVSESRLREQPQLIYSPRCRSGKGR